MATTMRTARCLFCGETFPVQSRSGPAPSYCSRAHRQRAYEQRRRTGRSDEEKTLTAELQTLRGRLRILETENMQLREELEDARQEMLRLQHQLDPPSATVQRLLTRPVAGGPTAAEPTPRRWWKPSR